MYFVVAKKTPTKNQICLCGRRRLPKAVSYRRSRLQIAESFHRPPILGDGRYHSDRQSLCHAGQYAEPSHLWETDFLFQLTEPRQSTEVREQSKEAVAQNRRQRVAEWPGLWIARCDARQPAHSRSPPTSHGLLTSPKVCKASANLASPARQRGCVPRPLLLSELGLGRVHY